jgi:copper(I)-binding protein
MRPVPDGLTIAPKATVSLGPGSYHLMFDGLKQPFKAGDQVRAVLRFQHAGAVPIVFDVGDGPKADQPMVMGPSSHMAMPMH